MKVAAVLVTVFLAAKAWDFPNPWPSPRPFGRGCPKTLDDASLCAVVWKNRFCRDDPWQLESGDAFPRMGTEWNDRVIVAVVRENCVLTLLDDENFKGTALILETAGFHPIRTIGWNGTYQTVGVSSMTCSCTETSF